MNRTEVSLDIGTVPSPIREYLVNAKIYDSSCSEDARTLLVEGKVRAYLKISKRGSLGREEKMTSFLSRYQIAPKAIAYESDVENDFLLTEAVSGEDGTARIHIDYPKKLAAAFGENLRMLHSLSTEGCPFQNRTAEMLNETSHGKDDMFADLRKAAVDDVVIHGDYCLPNMIMDDFTFKAFIDLGNGGIGDRHYDIYWGLWTLGFNFKTSAYNDIFLDAYGRNDIDTDRLKLFTHFVEATD